MALKTNDCPSCGSVDTVGCWDKPKRNDRTEGIAAGVARSIEEAVLPAHYPDARECVDCQHVWWQDPRPPINLGERFTVVRGKDTPHPPHWILACRKCAVREAALGCSRCEGCIRATP